MSEYLFSGLKVLDVGTWVAGPVAATILADFGADVIKVEIPGAGDQYRILSGIPGTPDADSEYMWQMDARNKRSLSLNLKTEEGMEVLLKLVAECDVYVTNQPFPMRRALSLNYEDLKKINPSMIYASLSAYGEEGPDRDREGFDLVAYWARTGLMDLVRDPQGKPAQSLPGMGDHPTAVSLYAGIVTALLKRERSGEGSMVHTSLLANGLWAMSCIAQAGFAGGSFERYRKIRATPGFTRNIYETKDGRYLQITMVRSPDDVARMFEALDAGHILEDERFSSPEARWENGVALAHELQEILIDKDSDEWMATFAAAEVPATRVGLIEEAMDDPQIRVNDMVVSPSDNDMNVPLIINHPLKISNVVQVGPKRAPEVGEHSDVILKELGYTDDVISTLRDKGVI
ncbi:MAG: CoA transferase [Gammaproteobacteria bacterium]|nr:CoA transferase [Gammaproteobacteria bacterium]